MSDGNGGNGTVSGIKARLEELSRMESGWLGDGSGRPLSREGLTRLSESIDRFCSDIGADILVYPTPEGDLEMEWTSGDADYILCLRLSDLEAVLTTPDSEVILDLSDGAGWNVLREFLPLSDPSGSS